MRGRSGGARGVGAGQAARTGEDHGQVSEGKQLNRKVEINAELRKLKNEWEGLKQ